MTDNTYMLKCIRLAAILLSSYSLSAAANQASMILGLSLDRAKSITPFVLNANNNDTEWNYNTNIHGFDEELIPYFDYTKCWGQQCVATATAASSDYKKHYAYIMTSHDAGLSWIANDVTPANTIAATVDYVDCNQQQCFAIGDQRPLDHHKRFWMLTSVDNFRTWQEASELPSNGNTIEATTPTCTNSYCVIAMTAYDPQTDSEKPAFLYADKNKLDWQFADSIHNTPLTRQLDIFDISCNGDACAAVGNIYPKKTKNPMQHFPTLYVTFDKGKTWQSKTVSDQQGQLTSIKCTPSLCIATGVVSENGNATGSLVVVSHDHGASWQQQHLEEVANVEYVFPEKVNCTDHFCVIGASISDNVEAMYLTTDGDNWEKVDITHQPTWPSVYMQNLSCNPLNCIGALSYQYLDINRYAQAKMAVFIGDPSGKHWTVANITNKPSDKILLYPRTAYHGE